MKNEPPIRSVPRVMLFGGVINYAALGLFAARPHALTATGLLLLLGTALTFAGAYRSREHA
jgi:hypothetical protein